MRVAIWFLIPLILTACAHDPASRDLASKKLIPITLLHTNDIHGHAWARDIDGEKRGGFSAQAALVDKIRAEVEANKGIVLLLSGGDVNTGVPESDLLEGEPDLRSMSLMNYDAMVLGNHDFDGGLAKLDRQQKWIHFPTLVANIVDSEGKPLRSPFVVFEKNGLKFAIIGLTTETLKKVVLARHVAKLSVLDPIKTAKVYVGAVGQEQPAVTIALTHVGVATDEQLAKEVPELNVIIGGHSHSLLSDGIKIGKTLIAQAGEKGEYLGRVDLLYDADAKKIVKSSASVLPVRVSDGENAKVKEMLKEAHSRVSKMLNEEIGRAQTELDGDRERVRHMETNLGNYVCDVLRAISKAQACLYNGGGLRASIPKGKIQRRDLFRVLPFRNTVVTGELTGKQIREALQTGLEKQDESGSFLHVSGIKYSAKGKALQSASINGASLSDSSTYKVVSNNFLFEGGDYMDVMKEAKNVQDTGVRVDDYLAKYMRTHQAVYPRKDNRIQLD